MNISSLQKGLVLHLPLDKTSFNPSNYRFTDVARGNHGTGHGTQLGSASPGFQADRMGQLVRATPFNGTDDYVDCGNDPSLNITDEITISVWAKCTNPVSTSRIYGKSTSVDRSFRAFISSNNFTFKVEVGGVDKGASVLNSIVNTNEWYHIVGIYDGTNIKAYVNTVETIGDAATGDINTSADDLNVGVYSWSGKASYFNGFIADVRIYNRALTSQERTLLHESYRPKVIA